jgi:dihydropteroate synthase
VKSYLDSRVAAAEAAGIPRWNIITDPGIGFAKNVTQNVYQSDVSIE